MENKTIFVNSINKLFDSIIWTHKIQRTYLEKLEARRKGLEILKIIFTTISSLSTAIFAILNVNIGTIISALVTILSVVFSEILEKVETKADIQSFKDSSTKLNEMRNEIIILRDKISAGQINDEKIEMIINNLNEKFSMTQRNLPTIPNKIVNLASSKLKERKDEEVDFKIL